MKYMRRAAGILLFGGLVFGQPVPQAVTDGASFAGRTSPGGLATIFGTGLAVDVENAQPPLPLPTILGEAEVTVNGVDAPLIYVSPGQINFQVPASTQPGLADLIVTVSGVSSADLQFVVDATSPGIFAYNATGLNGDPTLLQAVAQYPPNTSNLVSPSNPAPAGSTIILYVGGVGAVENPVADGYAASGADSALASSYAMVGGENAVIKYLGLSPGFVGLGQANIQIPGDLPSGDYPLVLNVGGLQSTSLTISVSGSGTLPQFLQEVSLFNNFEVSNRTTLQILNGSTLYLCGDVRVRVFDITDPSLPGFVNHYGEDDLNGKQISCSVNASADQPYLASVVGPTNAPSFTTFDLSADPQVPNPIGIMVPMSGQMSPRRVVFDGNTGLVNTAWVDGNGAKHGDIVAYDFTNPASPAVISTLAVDTDELKTFIRLLNGTHTLYATSGTANGTRVGGNGALDVIDTTDPSNLLMINQVAVPGTAILQAFAISGNTLLALGNSSDVTPADFPSLTFQGDLMLAAIDITDPTNPSVLATVDTGIQADGALRVVNLGGTGGFFAVTYNSPYSDPGGPTTLAVVDASNPQQPALYPQSTYYIYDGMATLNGYLYAANQLGMNIYQVILP